MENLLSSPARLSDQSTLNRFKNFFERHGVLGYSKQPDSFDGCHEFDRLRLVPLVFGLLPVSTLFRSSAQDKLKPIIRQHLSAIGIGGDEALVAILKEIADQFFEARLQRTKRKFSIEDIRANPHRYRLIRTRQANRCALCGVRFDGSIEETLDHIIPWALVGDVPDGSNWQILCSECNAGKGQWFSALQSPQALNWVYAVTELGRPTLETRFVRLALGRMCEVDGCSSGPIQSQLRLERRLTTGLFVADNLVIRCEKH